MAIEINDERLIAALKLVERSGPLPSQDQLWTAIANTYNSGEGLPKKFSNRPRQAITKSTVYQRITRRLKLAVKTPRKKPGRPSGELPKDGISPGNLSIILHYLQDEAVNAAWESGNQTGWKSINAAREALGKPPVDPIDNPSPGHFL